MAAVGGSLPSDRISLLPFHGQAVAAAPFRYAGVRRYAVAAAQNYGLVGNGRLVVVDVITGPDGACEQLRVVRHFDTRDGLTDAGWSESNESHVLAASLDGTIKLWQLSDPASRPVTCYLWSPSELPPGAPLELRGLDSNPLDRQLIAGAGAPGIGVWDVGQTQPIRQLREHRELVYSVRWSPENANVLLSASADLTVKLWDIRAPTAMATLSAHRHHCLSVDWNKYRSTLLASASADHTVKVWDLRLPQAPLMQLTGHQLPVRQVRWSPHAEYLLASVSYDRTLKMWDIRPEQADPLVLNQLQHSEFATGLTFALFAPAEVVTCGWDGQVVVQTFPFLT
jgi:peroxin-7